MLRFFRIEEGTVAQMPLALDETMAQVAEAHWIDAVAPDDAERQVLQGLLKTDVPETDDVEELETSARCFVDQAGMHVHALFLAQSEGRHVPVSVAFILQDQRLITIRDDEVADFRLYRLRARRGQLMSATPAELLVTMFDQKVENHADGLEDLYGDLEEMQVLVDQGPDLSETVSGLAQLEDSNGKFRLCLMDTQRDISFLQRQLRGESELVEVLRVAMKDVETLIAHTSFLFDKINFLVESTQGFISIEQNQIIKIFSIAAVVFMPPTMIASIYGMNFQSMPELSWMFGYPAVLLLMFVSGLTPYWYFKRKGFL